MKKFVKCLLASGLLVGLLAGCNTNKQSSSQPSPSSEAPSSSSETPSSSSSETPVPPEPPVPVKEEWTNAEKLIFANFEIEELPFDYEMSIEDVQDGVVFAVSKDEKEVEDVEAYSLVLEEYEVEIEGEVFNPYVAVGEYFGGLTYDLEYLGFDLDSADPVQYLRELDLVGTDYRYQNLVTVGLDVDGHLMVASATVCLPLFSGWEGIIGGGMEIYPLLYDSASSGNEVNFFEGYIGYVFGLQLQQNMDIAVNAAAFCDEIVHPEITKEITYAASLNHAVFYPYFLSNIYSSQYDQSTYSLFFINTNAEQTALVSYTQDDFDALIAEVQLSEALVSFDSETNVALYNHNGGAVEVTYSLVNFDEQGTLKCIELDYEVLGYEMPDDKFGIVGVLGTVAGFEATDFELREDQGLEIYDAWNYVRTFSSLEEALVALTEAAHANGYELEWSYDSENEWYQAEAEKIINGDTVAVELEIVVADWYLSSYGVLVVETLAYEITAIEYSEYLLVSYLMNNDDSEGNPYGYAYSLYSIFGESIFENYVAPYLTYAMELMESEDVTFETAVNALDVFIKIMDEQFGSALVSYAGNELDYVATLVATDYETSDWNKVSAAAEGLEEALEDAEESETYLYVAYYVAVLDDLLSNLQTWRAKYMEQLEAAYDAAYGWDEDTQTYKYDDDDFDADAVAAAEAAVDAFLDVINTESSTASQGKAKLNLAINKLKALTPDKQTLLDRLDAAYLEYDESDYSEANWLLLTGYYETARALIADEETSFDDGKVAYLEALDDMASVEKTLEGQLREYFAEEFNEEDYLPETWVAFQAFLDEQVQAITDAAEEDKEDVALAAMLALDEWLVNFYKAKLLVEFNACDPDDFTEHYAELESVYASCVSTIETATSETDMAGAITYFLQQRDALIDNQN